MIVFPAVALASCAWPADVVSPPPSGYVAYCNTATGLAEAIAPSTTFSLVGGTPVTVTVTGTDPIAVSSTGVISLTSDAALKTLVNNLGLTAQVPVTTLSITGSLPMGSLPATSVPVK